MKSRDTVMGGSGHHRVDTAIGIAQDADHHPVGQAGGDAVGVLDVAGLDADLATARRFADARLAFQDFHLALFTGIDYTRTGGSWVVIEVEQKEVYRLALAEDRVVHVTGPIGETEVEILKGKARIRKSPCSRKICIKSGYIQYADRITTYLYSFIVGGGQWLRGRESNRGEHGRRGFDHSSCNFPAQSRCRHRRRFADQ